MLFSRQAALHPRSIQRNDASSHWMPVDYWGINGCRSLRRSLSGLAGSPTGQARRRSQQRTYCCPLRSRATGPGVISLTLHETEWSGGTAVTISAIHRVSLATHDLAEAQKFFESYIGIGRAVQFADQTIAFGSGSRGLRIRKPPRLLNRTTSELHGSAGTRHVAFDTDDLNGIASRLDRAAIPYVHALPGDFDASAIYTVDPAMNVVAFCQRSTGGPTDQAIQSLVRS